MIPWDKNIKIVGVLGHFLKFILESSFDIIEEKAKILSTETNLINKRKKI